MWAKNRKITLALLVFVGLLGAVWIIRQDRAQAVGDQQYDMKLLQQVVDRIRAKYVDDLNEGEAIDAAQSSASRRRSRSRTR